MAKVNFTPEIKGEKEFRCYVCRKGLLLDIVGVCRLKLKCPRCKTLIELTMSEPIPAELQVRSGELVKL